MKAAVLNEMGKPLVVEEVDIDSPQKGEVKIRFAATAICGSDIGALKSKEGRFPLPMVAGHESAGYVEEVGEGVTSVKPGAPVVVSLLASCGQCYYCLTGLPHLCIGMGPPPMKSHLQNKQGKPIMAMGRVGGFAEYGITHQSQVVQISKDMPLDRAALLACGFITGFGAVVKRAQVKSLSSVVVIGTGGVGISAIQGAAFSGAYPVIAVDVLDNKMKTALTFGATHTVNAKRADAVEAVKKLTHGRGADYVFVTAAGSNSAIQQGFSMACRRGTIVVVGLPTEGLVSLSVPSMEFIHSERVITGGFMGSTDLRVDIPHLVELYQAGRIKLDEMITGRYPLEQINEAVESVVMGKALRNVIVF